METFSALLAICAGNSPVPGEFPAQRPVTRSFGVFFDLRLNKRLSKQSWGWWFETLSRPLWRHCNVKTGHTNSHYVVSVWSVDPYLHRRPVNSPHKGTELNVVNVSIWWRLRSQIAFPHPLPKVKVLRCVDFDIFPVKALFRCICILLLVWKNYTNYNSMLRNDSK